MKKIVLLFTIVSISAFSFAQNGLTTPQGSQKSEATQTVGLSTVSIVYHSPSVKGRTIWGGLVPYDKVWRCGANENTTITFSDNAQIEGKDVPAGTYGLHMIPSETEWTIILSSNSTSWGSYSYREDEDVVRVNVKPSQLQGNVESLNYGFINREANNATAYIEWEKLRVPFKVSFDVKEIVFQNMKNELRSLPGFGRTGHLQAAQYCLQNNFNHEQGLKWVDRAIQVNPGFASSSTKAGLLAQTGKKDEAKTIMDKIIDSASETELNAYGYQLAGNKDVKGAITIFEKNVEKHPKSWNAYDSLAEAYGTNGDKAKSIKNYKLALKNNPPANQKTRIEGLVK
jgi:Protein of unknown function (DUF2911)/Tetratricopeptide repeat